MRSSVLGLLFASMTMLAALPASADPTTDMVTVGQAFAAVHSFHAVVTLAKGDTMSMDMILPDKLHMTMNGTMQIVKIGNDMWMNMTGQWMHMSMPAGMMQRPTDMARTAGMQGSPGNYQITDLGPAVLDGTPAHEYHMVSKDGNVINMWVSNNLPAQVQITGKNGTTTVKYSEYNTVPDITPPA